MDDKTKSVVNTFCRSHYDIPQIPQLVIEFGRSIPDGYYCTRVVYTEHRKREADDEGWSDKVTKNLTMTLTKGGPTISFSLLNGNLKSFNMFKDGYIEESFARHDKNEPKHFSEKLSDKLEAE